MQNIVYRPSEIHSQHPVNCWPCKQLYCSKEKSRVSPEREPLGEAGCTINVYRLTALILVSREFGRIRVCERVPVRCRKLLSLCSYHPHSCYFKFSTQTQAEIAVSKSLVSKNLGLISKSVDNSIKAQLLLRLRISRAVQLLHPFGNSSTQMLL